jgi:anti-sigma-K factor RskA/sigma-70-like protein
MFGGLPSGDGEVLEAVLREGRTFGEVADELGESEQQVRSRAEKALVVLAPLTAVALTREERRMLAGYLLSQQSTEEAAESREHLARSEAARSWAASTLDSLERLVHPDAVPEIPAPRRAKRPDRRLLIAGACIALVAACVAVAVWPIGLLTGDDAPEDTRSGNAQARNLGAVQMTAVNGVSRATHRGGMAITAQGDRRQLVVSAQLPRTRGQQVYEVWLYNDRRSARSLGGGPTDNRGAFQGTAALPADYRDYRYIDISLEQRDGNAAHSGDSVLRGRIPAQRE